MSDAFLELEREYCPPIDSALLSAILSDFDLNDSQAREEAKATLDLIKASAVEEEASDFDPSGAHADVASETDESHSKATDLSSVSNAVSSLDLSEHTGPYSENEGVAGGYSLDLDNYDESVKLACLKDVFPSLNDFDISYTLRKCNGNWKQALDDLLNQVFISESGAHSDGEPISARGIDAFSEDNTARRGRKGKRKAKNYRSLDDDPRSVSLPSTPAESPAPGVNKWQGAGLDIDFIVSRSHISRATVSSTYYSHGASVPETITALLKESMKTNKPTTTKDAALQDSAFELGHDFPNIAPEYLTALIRLTQPSTADAHELAKALTTKPSTPVGSLQLIPRYTAPNLSDDDAAPTARNSQSKPTSTSPPLDYTAASRLANTSATARHTALTQAQAAYRLSRSNRLMAGAAGYYAQVSREHAASSATYTSAAADALVDSQSTALQLDLHGVSVQDAVRIARARTQRWWEGLGESRVNGRVGAGERALGFVIVTGVGRHSEGGRGKLGPAVSRVLAAEGWRVESGSGSLTVKGRARA